MEGGVQEWGQGLYGIVIVRGLWNDLILDGPAMRITVCTVHLIYSIGVNFKRLLICDLVFTRLLTLCFNVSTC